MKYLTKKDLSERIYGLETYIPGDESVKDLELRVTSGTTTLPVVVITTSFPMITTNVFQEFWFNKIGKCFMRITARRASCVVTANLMMRNGPAKEVVFVDQNDFLNPDLVKLIKEIKPSGLRSTTAFFQKLISIVTKEKAFEMFKNVKYYIFSGEPLSVPFVKTLKKLMPNVEIFPEYALSESGILTTSCPYLMDRYTTQKFQVFHPIKGREIEIKEPDNFGEGEIVFSSAEVPRYCTGDLGILRRELCQCGMDKTLLLLGRKDFDIIKVGGVTILRSEVERVFTHLKDLIDAYQVEVVESTTTEGEQELYIQLKVIANESIGRTNVWKETISEKFNQYFRVTPTQTLSDIISKNVFAPTVVMFLDSFPESIKNVPLRKVSKYM